LTLSPSYIEIILNDYVISVSASLGVTFYPQKEPIDAEQLFRQADQAMYEAKQAGKNCYQFFDMEQDRSVRGHHETLKRIHQGLIENEFVLYYQPKINMLTGEMVGVEALIRWQHPERGVLAPAEFLPFLEQNPLAIVVDKWVIETSITQFNIWKQSGNLIPVSINVGALYLEQDNFINHLEVILKANPEIGKNEIQLEILESSALNDISQISKVIEKCNQLGISFALDDFGTGYSSLNYLKRLAATTLKIDQSFVKDMLIAPDDLEIIKAIIGLAQAFNRDIVAEGVETNEHAEKLIQMGCEIGQGYVFAKPMPADKLLNWKASWKPLYNSGI
jgi:EAL domain-containing protein (putative c-di-GMP-specific phosphodiesterase class I)